MRLEYKMDTRLWPLMVLRDILFRLRQLPISYRLTCVSNFNSTSHAQRRPAVQPKPRRDKSSGQSRARRHWKVRVEKGP
jgi:hypothetical protein